MRNEWISRRRWRLLLAMALWGGACAVVWRLLGSKLISLAIFSIGASVAWIILESVHIWRGRNRPGRAWRWAALLVPLLYLGWFLWLLLNAWQGGYAFFSD